MTRILICLLSGLCLVAGHVNARPLDQLLQLRLGHMKDVAAYKWHHNLPIEDVKREKVVLKQASLQGLRYGLRVESSEHFFQLQIEAAKEIQRYWFEHWNNNPDLRPGLVPDLKSEIRPVLIELGNQITRALTEQPSSKPGSISVEGLSTETANRLLDATQIIETYPNQLSQVLEAGILRVGTTGDYEPFSYLSKGARQAIYEGIDIDLARDLAQSLQVELVWIETSWPALMMDLNSGGFDIGMSGISINLVRQRTAFFSLPYHEGGKTPIIRCVDKDQFRSLADIDKAGIRIIVNPGGTNQKFVTGSIRNAEVRVHQDNRTIFSEIANDHADVMITDAIEVRLQSANDSNLCPAMPGKTLTYSQKGYLLPQDTVWKEYINTWLSLRIEQGTVKKIFASHLDPSY
ncbi:MAG: gamma subclass chorismate mutase AroQ [bacterium]|nr:gamma subclass chorismate mutase AroQ [Gammaproteobacteria bacterium]HIL97621.1 gamma subclass chorismate mutase AroQ [Pseudomonadales bacterium]